MSQTNSISQKSYSTAGNGNKNLKKKLLLSSNASKPQSNNSSKYVKAKTNFKNDENNLLKT